MRFFASRFFGPSSVTGGGSPPAAPTATWADAGDGTGGTLTIDGEAGASHAVYVQAMNPLAGSWTAAGSRAGDGTVALTLDEGSYWLYVLSTSSGGATPSIVQQIAVTAPSTGDASTDDEDEYPSNFREAVEANFKSVFLNMEHFAEKVKFYPAGGGAVRTLRALIDVSSQPQHDEDSDEVVEEILVSVTDDRRDTIHGGIDEPRHGDKLQRRGETILYAWTGEIRTHEGGSWTLVYTRRRPRSVGGPARRR